MTHPVGEDKKVIGYYLGLFLLLGAMQAYAIYSTTSHSFWKALVDGEVFSLLLGVMGLGVWFVVRYMAYDKTSRFHFVSNHLVSALVFILIWFTAGNMILHLFVADERYHEFVMDSLPVRIGVGLLQYALLTATFYLIAYYQNLQEQEKQEAQLRQWVREAELRALKSQINPHFLFNSLNSISSLTLLNPENAREMIVNLSEFMRYSLKGNGEELVTLEKELHNIQLYLKIEQVRFGDKLKFHFNIPEDIMSCYVPALILQPLVENAIKYGVYQAIQEVEIQLAAEQIPEGVVISVGNDFEPDAIPPKGEGVGLNNVKERLRVTYGSGDFLMVEKNDNHFEVRMLIPQKPSIKTNVAE